MPRPENDPAFQRIGIAVAVVTTVVNGRRHGSTGMAWAEHAEPPLVLTTLNRAGTTRSMIGNAGRFAINLLNADQADLVGRFAGPGDRFAGLPTTDGPRLGLPLLPGCVARFECELDAVYPFGGYDIVVGLVKWHDQAASSELKPLIHYSGALWTVTPSATPGSG
jgi:flavin reductase (DIM6/NTAB) family NADH-FMN oxidoreductase RutF